MRLYSVALLVAGVLLANVERITSFELTTADYPTVVISSLADHQNGVAPKRLLRRNREDDEERAIGGGAISELTTKFKSSASNLAKKVVGMNAYEAKVATKLKLGRAADTLTSANLNKLTADIQQLNSKNIIKKVSVIGTLTAHYGDDVLAKALVTAEKKATDPSFALQIQALRKDQMTRWLKGGNSADDVFKLLKIRDNGYNMVASRKLEVLDGYLKFVNPKKYDQTSLIRTLNRKFGGENKVLALLLTGKERGHTANLLENSLMSKWQSEGQLPANVFQWLKLYANVDDAFTANSLNRIAKYVDEFNLKNPNTKRSTLELYRNSFGDAAVAKKLASAVGDPAKISVAEKLQAQQLQGWIRSEKSVGNVFTILGISKKERAAVISQKLDVLEEFIKLKGGERTLIEMLTETFNGNRNLATVLEKASPTAEATTLQKKQFAAWVDNGVKPENFMSSIWKTDVSLATNEQKSIAAKFKAFYTSLTSG